MKNKQISDSEYNACVDNILSKMKEIQSDRMKEKIENYEAKILAWYKLTEDENFLKHMGVEKKTTLK